MAIQTTKQQLYSIFILFVSIFSIILIGIITVIPMSPESLKIIEFIDYVICSIFFIDFLITFIRAENKRRYFFTWGWFDLLSSIPAVYFLRYFRFARILRIGRVLRGARAGKILATFILDHRAQGGIVGALLISVLIIFIGSISILQVEQGIGGSINTAEDALWWAATTMTTVGYGDKYPITTEGRIIASVLMFAGIGVFGVVSGFLAAWFISPSRKEDEKNTGAHQETIDALQTKIDSLDSKVEEILRYLKAKD
jgi:voltage-gated potassium channel